MPTQQGADAFFAKLGDQQRPHLGRLRELSLAEAERAGLLETLKWGWPVYVSPVGGRTVWMLQAFKHHCSLRFPVPFFADHRAAVSATGLEAIEGAVKFRWEQELPAELIAHLLRARSLDFQAGRTAWSDRSPRSV